MKSLYIKPNVEEVSAFLDHPLLTLSSFPLSFGDTGDAGESITISEEDHYSF